ncbi:MAG: hypothetical protein NC205_01480 [Prevotella sp.]|nr:hypothetical protein [Prevotella sp.]MCM1472847.1 hypothetical protein [Muribaculaceae bacterium]
MENLKQILKKIFFLSPVYTVIIAVPSFVLVFVTLAFNVHNALSYIAYIASAYALIITITGTPAIVKSISHNIQNHSLVVKLMEIPLIKKALDDVFLRTTLSLYQGLFINLIYIATKMFSGIYYHSLWFVSLSVYYILLAVMRFFLLHYVNTHKDEKNILTEFRYYRLCGIVLLLMNQALAGIVIFMVYQNKGFEYSGLLIYAMAVYSFYSVITAVTGVVKFRRHKSPVMSSAKVINLVSAIVSILSLETAMMSQFGNGDDLFRRIMTGATGGGVCFVVLGMAVFMIAKSTKILKTERSSFYGKQK